jgi:isoleucyl-tRNA synthetase
MVISTALFDKPAFHNLVVNGLVLAADGKKMSKRLKNYPDPMLVVNTHGADALRLYLINSPVVKGESLKFVESGVRGILRDVLLPWFNAYRFFAQQAIRWETQSGQALIRNTVRAKKSDNVMDVWITASLASLVKYVHEEMEAYRLYTVVPRLISFLGDLTNWYVRLNRSRLKGSDGEHSALTSLAVLFEVLLTMTVVMSPFTPFFAEYLYQRLRLRVNSLHSSNSPSDIIGEADSIHYVMLPTAQDAQADGSIVIGMRLLQQAVELGRRAREAVSISMKIPVKEVLIVCDSTESIAALKDDLKDYLLEELNAWGVSLTTDVEKWCSVSALPNLPVLARRLGNRIRAATSAIKALDSQALRAYAERGSISITAEGESLQISQGELIVKSTFAGNKDDYAAMTSLDGTLTVAVCTIQDDVLRKQAIVRDLCNRINKLRKKAKLNITDRVDIFYADLGLMCQETNPYISTAEAIAHNLDLLDRANIIPMPLKRCCGQIIISDVNATLFGSSFLKVALALPVVSVSSGPKIRFAGDSMLDLLLASCLLKGNLRGSIGRKSFDLIADEDLFPSAAAVQVAYG